MPNVSREVETGVSPPFQPRSLRGLPPLSARGVAPPVRGVGGSVVAASAAPVLPPSVVVAASAATNLKASG